GDASSRMGWLALAEERTELAYVQLRRSPRRPPRAIEGREARWFRRSLNRRAYERICRELCPTTRVADGVRGLGRLGGSVARGSGDLRRRPLHITGPPASQPRPVELSVGARDEHDAMA